jgi:hypothetical protein
MKNLVRAKGKGQRAKVRNLLAIANCSFDLRSRTNASRGADLSTKGKGQLAPGLSPSPFPFSLYLCPLPFALCPCKVAA